MYKIKDVRARKTDELVKRLTIMKKIRSFHTLRVVCTAGDGVNPANIVLHGGVKCGLLVLN